MKAVIILSLFLNSCTTLIVNSKDCKIESEAGHHKVTCQTDRIDRAMLRSGMKDK